MNITIHIVNADQLDKEQFKTECHLIKLCAFNLYEEEGIMSGDYLSASAKATWEVS